MLKPQVQETEFFNISAKETGDIISPSEMEEPVLASIESQPSFLNVDLESRLIQETRRVKREGKKSFVDAEEDEHKWSKMAITSFALGGTGFMVALTAIILMFVAQNNGGLNTTYAGTGLIMAATNIFIGIGGVLFGVAAKREIQRYGHKGRGFRKAGFVSGLISLGSVIGVLLVALIMLANSCNAIE